MVRSEVMSEQRCHTEMKAITFHATGEKPVLALHCSRESAEWLLHLIPTDDGAFADLQQAIDALSDEHDVGGAK